jgi:hypothetical protein
VSGNVGRTGRPILLCALSGNVGRIGRPIRLTFFLSFFSELDFLHSTVIASITDYLNKKEAVNKFAWVSAE